MGCNPERAVRRLGTVCCGKVFREVEVKGFWYGWPIWWGDPGCCRGLTSPEKCPCVEREFLHLSEAADLSAINLQALLDHDFLKTI